MSRITISTFLAATCAFVFSCTATRAAVIAPDSVSATHSLGAYPADETWNGSGLNTYSDPDPLNWDHDRVPANTNSKAWLGDNSNGGPTLTYQFNTAQDLSAIYFWNYLGNANRSLTSFGLAFFQRRKYVHDSDQHRCCGHRTGQWKQSGGKRKRSVSQPSQTSLMSCF